MHYIEICSRLSRCMGVIIKACIFVLGTIDYNMSLPDPHDRNSDDDIFFEDLPATQPFTAFILESVTAYVEVRTGGDNRSRGIRSQLANLGATIADKFTADVTHVVFKEGKLSTYKKAVKRRVHLVSVLWIKDCEIAMMKVCEKLYPPYNMQEYTSTDRFKKIKRVKSYQPDYGDEKMKRMKRMRPKRRPIENVDSLAAAREDAAPECRPAPKVPAKLRGPCDELSKENGKIRALYSMVGEIDFKYDSYVRRPSSPNSSDEEKEPTPLAVRLLRRIMSSQLNDRVAPSSADRGSERPVELSPVSSIVPAQTSIQINDPNLVQIEGCKQ